MKQYIDKAALVAEIERRLEKIANASSEDNRELSAIHGAQQYELINLVQYINTLEVKEIGLDLGSPDVDMGVKTVWNGDKIVSGKTQKGE